MQRKLLVCLVLFVMMWVNAGAEDINSNDIALMNDENLITLRTAVDHELIQRVAVLTGSEPYYEVMDVSTLSTDVLLRLQSEISGELTKRSIDPTDLMGVGIYRVGIDVKPGRYRFTVIDEGSYGIYIKIYKSYASWANNEKPIYFERFEAGESLEFELLDSMVIAIDAGALQLSEAPKRSWSP